MTPFVALLCVVCLLQKVQEHWIFTACFVSQVAAELNPGAWASLMRWGKDYCEDHSRRPEPCMQEQRLFIWIAIAGDGGWLYGKCTKCGKEIRLEWQELFLKRFDDQSTCSEIFWKLTQILKYTEILYSSRAMVPWEKQTEIKTLTQLTFCGCDKHHDQKRTGGE